MVKISISRKKKKINKFDEKSQGAQKTGQMAEWLAVILQADQIPDQNLLNPWSCKAVQAKVNIFVFHETIAKSICPKSFDDVSLTTEEEWAKPKCQNSKRCPLVLQSNFS